MAMREIRKVLRRLPRPPSFLVVLLAMMFLLPTFPVSAQAETPSYSISLGVYNSSRPSFPIEGASVTFEDAHTGAVHEFLTNVTGMIEFFPSGPASFKVIINATGYYDYRILEPSSNDEFLRYDNTQSMALGDIFVLRLPSALHQVDIRMDQNPPGEVDLRIAYAGSLDQTAYEGRLLSNTSILLPTGSYRAIYHGIGLEPNETIFKLSSSHILNLTITNSTIFNVDVTLNTRPTNDTTVYLVSYQKSELGRMLIEPRVQGGSRLTFDAYPGTFYLVVGSGAGKGKVVDNVTLPASAFAVDLSNRTRDRTTDTFQISNVDWNLITLSSLKQLQGDSSVPMMQLNRLPGFRMQLDMDPTVGGNRNGQVDATEVYNYSEMMKRMGPDNITTAGLCTVDGLALISDANEVEYTMATTGLIGTPVWSEADYATTLSLKYSPMGGALINGKASYLVLLNPAYNSTYQGWSYKVRLPTSYVLLGASVYKDPVTIKVSDYTTVRIDSANYRPGDRRPALVSLPVVTAKEPSASVGVVLSSSTYYVGQSTYIIRSGLEMSFTAFGSSDPNGNPLTYIWTFGDGDSLITNTPQVPHTYWIPNLEVPMSLTVRDVSMRTDTANLTLKVDGVNPRAIILVNGTTPGPLVQVDQLQSVEYSAAPSYDRIYNEMAPQGVIKRFDWNFGDGFFANDTAVARHAYLEPGRFNLTSTITDVSGRVTITTYAMQVRDTVGPIVIVNITRVADGTAVSGSAVIGDALLFDGSRSTDPGGIVSYSWSFGDGSTAEGATVQHTYSRLGTITGRLTCVDAAGNSGFRPFSLTILPMPGPDLRITEMCFSPTTYTEGSAGTASIDVVNVGSAAAYNINTRFYLVRAEGNTLLAQVHDVTVNGIVVDHLDIGQTGIVSVSLSFATQGSYTIRANATADGELNPGDNSRSATLQVQESAWKYAGIYFGIIFLVVVLAVLFYMRRGIGVKKKDHRGKKGKKR